MDPVLSYSSSRSDLERALAVLDRVAASDRDYDYWVRYGRWTLYYSDHFSGSVRESLLCRSLECYERALLFRPHDAWVLMLCGAIERRRGNMERGWALDEHRHRFYERVFPRPLWDGSSFPGRTLLVHHEQGGLGDMIQFSRYFPELYRLSQPGGGVILLMFRKLERLFRECFDLGGIRLHSEDGGIPSYDDILPLFSIFHRLDPALSRMGIDRPYMSAPARRIERDGDKRRIGLIWASTSVTNRAHKSIPLDCLVRLGCAEGVHFYSLQYERDLNDAVRSRSDLSFIDLSLDPESMDFYDLACAMSGLDGVISVDTAGAHLAGSMFCPLLVLVAYRDRSWHWNDGTYEDDWYPSAVRMCQDVSADWGVVLDRVVARLNGGLFPDL